ncbi:hypothetical protein CLV97_12343 [Planifilum fimeticola]|uniref:Uncharacterized protein n=1 Tax=Planifilum fimeticola TaxID=201975 RepID=A0A2T0LCE4_9BACL|nr:hypothetical protein CLV97_12343 [Planifilum fimeticola]
MLSTSIPKFIAKKPETALNCLLPLFRGVRTRKTHNVSGLCPFLDEVIPRLFTVSPTMRLNKRYIKAIQYMN